MSFFKTTLIAAAFSLAVAGNASAQSDREEIHRGQSGDQYDLFIYTTPFTPAPFENLAQPGSARTVRGRSLYMTTQPPVRTDESLFDRAKGSVRDAN